MYSDIEEKNAKILSASRTNVIKEFDRIHSALI